MWRVIGAMLPGCGRGGLYWSEWAVDGVAVLGDHSHHSLSCHTLSLQDFHKGFMAKYA